MVKVTMVARVRDGLPLCEGLEMDKIPDMDSYKQQAKVGGRVVCALIRGQRCAAPGNARGGFLISSQARRSGCRNRQRIP